MISGLSGSLLSHDALADASDPSARAGAANAHRWARTWYAAVLHDMGPTSRARAVFDRVALPLANALGFHATPVHGPGDAGRFLGAALQAGGTVVAALAATEWGRPPAAAWGDSVRHAIGLGVRWCLCVTGPTLRIFDARRTYSRRFAQFDLEAAASDQVSFATLWWLLRADAFRGAEPVLERAVAISERHRADVRLCLQHGVHDALAQLLHAFASARHSDRRPAAALLDESLIVVYRILFLLFAEARGLVPQWHPVYRDSYTIESLREPIERLARPRGLWQSLQAIARLAHRGCRAGALRVPAFNGRLFSPVHAPLADSLALDDGAVRNAMAALTTRPARDGMRRISYADLGVEQLGGVYERVLDFEAVRGSDAPRIVTLVRGTRRKATGAFYTPRALTEFLVRRALAPLVSAAGPDEILALRVLDPAMGSGAFLVAACRYLAAAYESALLREQAIGPSDIGDADRAGFRRVVAQRCLFGVDINPMAVQLGRLSLWLATLAGDRPLTFLDHHLRAGNSVAGASLEDVLRQPPSGRRPRTRHAPLPLFDLDAADSTIRALVGPRLSLAMDPGDTIEQVRAKERLLTSLQREGTPLAAWKAVADLWCASWFRNAMGEAPRPPFSSLVDAVLGRGALPSRMSQPFLDDAAATARRELFFHWPLEFPEIFHDPDGRPSSNPGFDAVVGNPPWEMLRGHRAAASDPAGLTTFARSSGVFAWQGDGQANLYQLFLERALSLTRSGGRVAMVAPAGFASDHGCAALRRAWRIAPTSIRSSPSRIVTASFPSTAG